MIKSERGEHMPGFEEIVGHEQIVTHLKSAMKLGKVSHAYILSGERDAAKSCWQMFLRKHCSVKREAQSLVAAAILVYRHRAATILTSYI